MVALIAAFAATRVIDDDTPPPIADRIGSVALDRDGGRGERLTIGAEPAAYRIVFRLEQTTGNVDDVTVSTDVVSVQRPFQSRLDTKRGAPPGGALLSVQVGRFGHIETRGQNRATATIAAVPGVAPSDVRIGSIVGDLLERGQAELREQREVVGRRCQVLRTGRPLSSLGIAPPSEAEYADNCVDAEGLVLEELYVVDGSPLSRRVATSVDTSPDLAETLFRTQKVTIPVEKGGGSVQEVAADRGPEGDDPFWELPAPPGGHTHMGRYSVVPPQAENFSDPLRRKFILATVADVYTDGPDLIVVDQGSTLEGGQAFTPAPEGTPTVDVGELGSAEIHLDAHGAELRVHTRAGAFVRAYGTVPVDSLARVLRELRPTTGTGLVYPGRG